MTRQRTEQQQNVAWQPPAPPGADSPPPLASGRPGLPRGRFRMPVWLVIGAVLVGCAWPLAAQVFIQGNNVQFNGQTLPTEEGLGALSTQRKLTLKLRAAEDLFKEQQYAEGVIQVQQILDGDEDCLLPKDGIDSAEEPEEAPARNPVPVPVNPLNPPRPQAARAPAGQTAVRSAKREALRLLADLPAEGRDAYEAAYGASASTRLAEAVESGSDEALQDVYRVYALTESGQQAGMRLAQRLLERQMPVAAARLFDQLADWDRKAGPRSAALRWKAIVAWQRAGESAEADKRLQNWDQKTTPTVELAGQKRSIPADPAARLTWLQNLIGVAPQARENDGWRLAEGAASRNGRGPSMVPYLATPGWSVDIVRGSTSHPAREGAVLTAVREAVQMYRSMAGNSSIPLIPSTRPLVSSGRVITRGYGNTLCFDLFSGRLLWASALVDPAWNEVTRSIAAEPGETSLRAPLSQFIGSKAWQESTHGTQSADDKRVFVVESLPGEEAEGPANLPFRGMMPPAQDTQLAAYDLASGRMLWRAGGRAQDRQDQLAGVRFLGPPLPLDGRLYTLADQGNELRLWVLDAQTGQLQWSLGLMRADRQAGLDTDRERRGLSPAFADGLLICPTEMGQIVAVDLVSRSLLWSTSYELEPDLFAQQRVFFGPDQDLTARLSRLNQRRWVSSVPVIASNRVLVTSRSSTQLTCLSLLDGQVLWSRPRGERMYVGGVEDGRVLIVGRNFVETLQLSNGEAAWAKPVNIPTPSGIGVMSAGQYHVPLSTGEVLTLSVATGETVHQSQTGDRRPLGNLVSAQGAILSQREDSLDVFHDLEKLFEIVDRRLKKNPEDLEAMVMQAEILAHRGQKTEALQMLRKAHDLRPDEERIRQSLAVRWLDALRSDFPAHRGELAEIRKILRGDEEMGRFLTAVGEGYLNRHEIEPAVDTLLQLAEIKIPQNKLEPVRPDWRVRPDRFVRGKLSDLLASANPAERELILSRAQSRLTELQKRKLPRELQRFLTLFDVPEIAPSARATLIAAHLEQGDWLAAQLNAQQQLAQLDLRAQQNKAQPAGQSAVPDKPVPDKAAPDKESSSPMNNPDEGADSKPSGKLPKDKSPEDKSPEDTSPEDKRPEAEASDDLAAEKDPVKAQEKAPASQDAVSGDASLRTATYAALCDLFLNAGRPREELMSLRDLTRLQPEYEFEDGETAAKRLVEWQREDPDAGSSPPLQWPEAPSRERVELPAQLRVIGDRLVIPVTGDPGPYFRDCTFEFQALYQQLWAKDELGHDLWRISIPNTDQGIIPYVSRIQVSGQLVLLWDGRRLTAIDGLGTAALPRPTVLWQRDLMTDPDANLPATAPQVRMQINARGQRTMIVGNANGQSYVSMGPLTPRTLAYSSGTQLRVVDPLTGDPFWERDGIPAGSKLLGNAEVLAVIPSGKTEARLFRMSDGAEIGTKTVPPASSWLGSVGMRLICAAPEREQTVYSAFDVQRGEAAWSQPMKGPTRAHLLGEEELAIFDGPSGLFTVLNLETGKKTLELKLTPEPDAQRLLAYRSAAQYLVLPSRTVENQSNAAMTGFGRFSELVDGTAHGIDRQKGQLAWSKTVRRMATMPYPNLSLPVWIFAGQFLERDKKLPIVRTSYRSLVLDTRNGDELFAEQDQLEPLSPQEIAVDVKRKRIELRFYKTMLRLDYEDHSTSEPDPTKN